ncbi:MAG: iron-containing alcohol dehydrogenase [Phycisphaerales bacterium]|nr:iron-containing alcohol dehydrogenase [Phycisphaerales bacterium]
MAILAEQPRRSAPAGVADMMSHIFERYFTNTLNTDVTDGLCETLLKTIMKNALIVIDDPKNYDAWCEVGFAGALAHNNLVGLGREQVARSRWIAPPTAASS